MSQPVLESCNVGENLSTIDACLAASDCFNKISNNNNLIEVYNQSQRDKLQAAIVIWEKRRKTHYDNNNDRVRKKREELARERRDWGMGPNCKSWTGGCEANIDWWCNKDFGEGWVKNSCRIGSDTGCGAPGNTWREIDCKKSDSKIATDLENWKRANIFEFKEAKPTQEGIAPLMVKQEVNSTILCCNNSINLTNATAADITQSCQQTVTQTNTPGPIDEPELIEEPGIPVSSNINETLNTDGQSNKRNQSIIIGSSISFVCILCLVSSSFIIINRR